MKRIIAFTLACLLASPAWAGDFPNPGSASHRARDDGWIDIDNLPFLCDDAHGRGAYNICKENGNGSGLILHETESIGEGELLTFLNDAANQAVGMALGGGGEFFIQHFANLHFYENGGEQIIFNEGEAQFDYLSGIQWPGEGILLHSVDDGIIEWLGTDADPPTLIIYDQWTRATDDEPFTIDVTSFNASDEEWYMGGITFKWGDATQNSEDTLINFNTTVGGVDDIQQLTIGNGIYLGDASALLAAGGTGSMHAPGDGEGTLVGALYPGDTTRRLLLTLSAVVENPATAFYPGLALGDNSARDSFIYRADEPGAEGPGLVLQVDGAGSAVTPAFDDTLLYIYQEDTDNIQFDADGGANVSISLVPKGAAGIYAVQPSTAVNDDNLIKVTGWKMIPLMAGAGTVPSGGGIAGCTPVSAFDSGSNDVFLRQCSFSASTDNAIYFTIPFGSDWDHFAVEPEVNIRWTSATTTDSTDDVIWNASIVCFSNDDAINGNAFPADDAVTDTQTAAGDILRTGAITGITAAGTPADDDTCVLRVRRDADNGSDNFNGTAELISVELWTKDDQASEF